MFRCSVCITDLCDIIVWFAAVHYGAWLLILLTVRQIYPMEATTMKKFRNKKGFTLAELLIVLAIIAILMAIAIPLFSNQLEKARISVDEANARSASSMAQAHYLITHINESSRESGNRRSHCAGTGSSELRRGREELRSRQRGGKGKYDR